jgi:hypothetical protein
MSANATHRPSSHESRLRFWRSARALAAPEGSELDLRSPRDLNGRNNRLLCNLQDLNPIAAAAERRTFAVPDPARRINAVHAVKASAAGQRMVMKAGFQGYH